MYSQEKKNKVQISRHLNCRRKWPSTAFTFRFKRFATISYVVVVVVVVVVVIVHMYTCNLKANTCVFSIIQRKKVRIKQQCGRFMVLSGTPDRQLV